MSTRPYIIIPIVLFIFTENLCAQNYATVDQIVKEYSSVWPYPEDLAKQINHDFSTQAEKARAIYDWIAYNISYDTKKYFSQDMYTTPYYVHSLIKIEKSYFIEAPYRIYMAEEAMYTKKTLCEGYASLYKRLADLTGLECVIIPGYAKMLPEDIGRKPASVNHTWNAVKTDGQWQLLDVTWGAGKLDYDKNIFIRDFSDAYFFVPPERFFLQHCPKSLKWSFTDKTMEDFIALPFFYREYISWGIDIIEPEKGLFYTSEKIRIKFRIKNFPKNTDLSYTIKEGGPWITIYPRWKAGITTFTINVNVRHETYLTIFTLSHAIATYKIIPR
ncbi:MAG TPA: hypothetical protein ENK25_00910 [Bacteroidetes bacterium]|nr:hypothetical protein [Bacteroidota bacterium]